jgi:hypothetical protein
VPPVVVVVVGDAFVQEAGARAPAVVVVDRNERDVEVDGCSIDVDDGSAVEVVGSDGPVVDVTVLAVPSPAESFTPLPPWAHDPRTASARPATPARHAEPSINAILTECRPQRTRQTRECPGETQTSRRAARPTAGPGPNRRSSTGIERKTNAGTCHRDAWPQPAFAYRDTAENERRFEAGAPEPFWRASPRG